jgi:CheY-like chemotaxis protein
MGASAGSTYVNCFHCQSPYNTLTTNWCSCIVAERSLVCPACLKCFCKAPAVHKEQFWESASRALLVRRREEHGRPLPATALPDSSAVRRPLVLVVDDEAGILRLAIRAIKGIGLGVIWCEDGSQALDLARQYHPEIVLTDVVMPHADGREVCRQIKQEPELSRTKVIVMTGVHISARDVAFGRQNGADDYLAKPIDFVELGALLRRHAGTTTPS